MLVLLASFTSNYKTLCQNGKPWWESPWGSWGNQRFPRHFGKDSALSARPQRSAVMSCAHLAPSLCSTWQVCLRFALLRFSRQGDSNPRPAHYECVALPSELCRHQIYINTKNKIDKVKNLIYILNIFD